MSKIMSAKRGTGRTSRMIKAALDACLRGERAVIVAAGSSERQRIFFAVQQQLPRTPARIEPLVIAFHELRGFDWATMRAPGMPDGSVFFDHHVIEGRLNAALRELHRFDEALAGADPEVARGEFGGDQ